MVPLSTKAKQALIKQQMLELRKNKQKLTLAELEEREPELLPHIHTHMLRHTFSSNRNRNGGNPIVTRDMMGHKRIQQTEAYTHSSLEDMIEDVHKIDTKILKFG